jgi:putative sigma-54 modulation protein
MQQIFQLRLGLITIAGLFKNYNGYLLFIKLLKLQLSMDICYPYIIESKGFIMNKSITGRHFDLTDPIKQYAQSALDGLKKYNLDIISANTIISANEKAGKKGFAVEFIINLKDKNTIVVTQVDKDVYAAIDLAIERMKKSLRRHADKIKDHKIMSFRDLGEEAEAVGELTSEEVEIVPMDLELHKPLEFDDAIDALRAEKKRQFIVFNDQEGQMRVMYKRADGKFGLY